MDTFSQWLREMMKRRQMKPGELAYRADLSESGVRKLMSGDRQPSWEVVVEIANVFSVPVLGEIVPRGDSEKVEKILEVINSYDISDEQKAELLALMLRYLTAK